MAVKGVIYNITKKKHIRDLKISSGIYWGEAVKGGAVWGPEGLGSQRRGSIGRDDCIHRALTD